MALKKKKKSTKKVSKKPTKKKALKKPTKKVQKKTVKKSVAKKATKKVSKKSQPVVKKNIAPIIISPKKNVDYAKAITPLGDRLVVRVVSADKITAGGLIIPASVNTATGYLKAEVLAVGTGAKSKKGHLKPLDVRVGDKVLFSEYSGTKIEFNSEELQIIHETDVMGIVQD